jgi:type II secretory ATPase GspE/PulE/Tfp pilus assembly ATPase PilB-like protein
MLRQDPDIILVGEVRDQDTADMALRAAMTGHQVFSTLHTNSAVGAIPRLLDLGIVPDVLAGNIIGVIAQRLVRKLCVRCRSEDTPNDLERRLLRIDADRDTTVYRANGCDFCHQSGYKGRIAVTELLKVDADIDDLISHRASRKDIHDMAISKGFEPIIEDGFRRVLDGTTTLEEVSRVIDLTGCL